MILFFIYLVDVVGRALNERAECRRESLDSQDAGREVDAADRAPQRVARQFLQRQRRLAPAEKMWEDRLQKGLSEFKITSLIPRMWTTIHHVELNC